MTAWLTTRPRETWMRMSRIASAARKASGMVMRLLEESSRVRSNICSAAVCSGLPTRFMRKRERPVTRSVRTGLRLVGHRAGANLIGFEGFIHFLEGGEHSDIHRHLVGGGGQCRERGDDLGIDDARVGLAGDGVDAGEAEAFGDGELELADFFRGRLQTIRGTMPACRWSP